MKQKKYRDAMDEAKDTLEKKGVDEFGKRQRYFCAT